MPKIESLGKIDIVNHKSESGIIKLLSLLSGAVGIKEFKDKVFINSNAYKKFQSYILIMKTDASRPLISLF